MDRIDHDRALVQTFCAKAAAIAMHLVKPFIPFATVVRLLCRQPFRRDVALFSMKPSMHEPRYTDVRWYEALKQQLAQEQEGNGHAYGQYGHMSIMAGGQSRSGSSHLPVTQPSAEKKTEMATLATLTHYTATDLR